MSFKAKNLSYEAQEPAFLRRLRSQQSGDSDRHERPIARPRRAKAADEDDGPTYVDGETNNTLSKDEYEALVAEDKTNADASTSADHPKETTGDALGSETTVTEAARVKQDVTEIGKKQKKRKAAKIVVAEDELEDDHAPPAKDAKKQKKKPKAVKLSFGAEQS